MVIDATPPVLADEPEGVDQNSGTPITTPDNTTSRQSPFIEPTDEELEYLPLIVERVPYDDEEVNLSGRRVVDINHVLKQLQIISSHPNKCTMGKYKLKKEYLSGLFSKWTFWCDNCEKEFVVTSVPPNQEEEVNDALSWGAMSVGVGYSQIEEMFSVLDIPVMSHKKYKHHEEKIGQVRLTILHIYINYIHTLHHRRTIIVHLRLH